MEIINDKPNQPQKSYFPKRNISLPALLLVLVGILFLGRNLGFVDHQLFRVVISWQMLLIVLGIWSLVKRRYTSAIVLVAVGLFFLAPRLGHVNHFWISTYWPLLLVLVGVVGLFKVSGQGRHGCKKSFARNGERLDSGYVVSENTFGNAQQIVLDPLFKGADISNSFGGTLIDLRRTNLLPGDTVIDLNCAFGGIELYVPEDWTVVFELESAFSATHDKRYGTQRMTEGDSRLVVRGKLAFSRLEIKN